MCHLGQFYSRHCLHLVEIIHHLRPVRYSFPLIMHVSRNLECVWDMPKNPHILASTNEKPMVPTSGCFCRQGLKDRALKFARFWCKICSVNLTQSFIESVRVRYVNNTPWPGEKTFGKIRSFLDFVHFAVFRLFIQ